MNHIDFNEQKNAFYIRSVVMDNNTFAAKYKNEI